MSAYLDETYSGWLYDQIFLSGAVDPGHSYRELTYILYTTEFVWLVPNDDNRVEDGKALRYEFLDETGIEIPEEEDYWLDLGCSVLEALFALARRLDFQTGRGMEYWYLKMLENLGLLEYHDDNHIPESKIKKILDQFIWRTYSFDGTGGLFPLRYPESDQREAEIWYQMNAYLLERSYV